MASTLSAAQLIPALRSLQYSAFVDVGALTILVYDYAITFDDERNLMWTMSFKSPAKILFFVTRYLPFVDMSICIYEHFKSGMTGSECFLGAKIMGWLISFGLMFSEIILTLRTWALWEHNRKVGIGLCIWFGIIWIPQFVITGIFLKSLVYATLPSPLLGCLAVAGNPIDFADWALLMVYEGGVLTLMVIKAYQSYKLHGRSVMYKTVYQDGSIFYLYLFVLSALNIICILTFPDGMSQILTNFERIIHSVLTARILIALRGLGAKRNVQESLQVDSNIIFELDTFKAGIPSLPSSTLSSDVASISTGEKSPV